MKEKTKNILKGIGVGTLACLGMFGLTGCAFDVNGTDDLNAKLEQLQQTQQETNALLVNQQVVDSAWNLFKKSYTNLLLNTEGIRDNVVINFTQYQENVALGFYKTSIYKTESQETVLMMETSESDRIMLTFEFEESLEGGAHSSGVYTSVSNIYRDEFETKTKISGYDDIQAYIVSSNAITWCIRELAEDMPNVSEFTKEDICAVEILPNGNYAIEFVSNNLNAGNGTGTIISWTVEISEDCKIINHRTKLIDVNYYEGHQANYSNVGDFEITYSYETVDSATILSCIDEAKAATTETED